MKGTRAIVFFYVQQDFHKRNYSISFVLQAGWRTRVGLNRVRIQPPRKTGFKSESDLTEKNRTRPHRENSDTDLTPKKSVSGSFLIFT